MILRRSVRSLRIVWRVQVVDYDLNTASVWELLGLLLFLVFSLSMLSESFGQASSKLKSSPILNSYKPL